MPTADVSGSPPVSGVVAGVSRGTVARHRRMENVHTGTDPLTLAYLRPARFPAPKLAPGRPGFAKPGDTFNPEVGLRRTESACGLENCRPDTLII